MLPAAGTGPFRLSKVLPREFAELTRFDGYWDQAHKAKVDVIRLLPIPEANSRLAALRSGQVDWIEVPPPDGIPSLKAAGFSVVTNSYPHTFEGEKSLMLRTEARISVFSVLMLGASQTWAH
jgi:peptide/nickel transport system substrate-binding protein